MSLTINGVIAIKDVQKKMEQGYNNSQKTVYYGTLITKEEFGQNNIEMPFKMEAREKQVQFLDQYLMQAGKSGVAKGFIISSPNGPAVQLEKFEFGSIKMPGNNNGGYNNNNNNNYNNNNNGGFQQNNNNGGGFQQPQPQPTFQGNGGGNMFNQGQPQQPQNPGNADVPGAEIPANDAPKKSVWANFK